MSEFHSNGYLSLNIKDCFDGAGETVWLMKCLLREYEDLNLIPRTHTKQCWMCQCSFVIPTPERQG